MYQYVCLVGRVGMDAECENKKRPVNFSIATWENFRDEEEESGWKTVTTWHNCIMWGTPEIKKHYMKKLKKGVWVQIEGKIVHNKWEDDEGNKRVTTRVQADKVRVIPNIEAEGSTAKKEEKQAPKKSSDSWDDDDDGSDDLPF